MSGGVAYQQGYQSNQFFGNMNTDPGVYEPECDFYDNGQPDYPDTSEFLAQYAGGMTEEGLEIPATEAAPVSVAVSKPATPAEDLALAGDYHGMGGPKSVPLYTPLAFDQPAMAVQKTILDEIFMEPTQDSLSAYNRVIMKAQVVQNKGRLKWSIFMHYVLVFAIITKLMPEILDKLDIFVLEVEELFVPKPYIWEFLWLLSIPVTFFGLSSCKKSSFLNIKKFILGTLLCSILPILIGVGCHASECYEFISEGVTDNIAVWQGFPYSMLWYVFFFVAIQVHMFELYFANCLMQAWIPKKKTQ